MSAAVPPDLEGQFQRIAEEQRRRAGRSEPGGDEQAGHQYTPDDSTGKGKQSQATKLVDLGRRTPLFHDPEGNGYATVPVGHHDETWRLRSGGFRSYRDLAKQS